MLTVNANILDVPADALLITIDGAKAGMAGNIARQFARRWPEAWTSMVRTLRFPIPLGRTVALPWEGDAPWKLFLFASTLHHLDVLEDAENGCCRLACFSRRAQALYQAQCEFAVDASAAGRLATLTATGTRCHVGSGCEK